MPRKLSLTIEEIKHILGPNTTDALVEDWKAKLRRMIGDYFDLDRTYGDQPEHEAMADEELAVLYPMLYDEADVNVALRKELAHIVHVQNFRQQ
ncbi:uncharacterized protein LACBIDRAFT_318724 [Laccaria bicolor S238N-H82]|uniref:Predicted protein n=1 Tax=Laccaria bicolor (strain S238N-H82 / ATCC MYA-4686) TaxID=486041 RepID=B0D6X3_LACBS|nr:uncharacterized protein LACBIDRAFT_318724 [Laccaria bicolor S238N-H82]EDR09552.1 predicted protein [Laccaria bicolor S238N-H82]|eukprot:XP_001879901.1 predicted protein [Laccaria bicolor S238N-H82]